MIEIKLKEIADRLGKSIMDIARETGLNRNTVTDLYHNRVDGIKFSTIDLLCETYGLSLADLLYRKEVRVGATPASKIVREILSTTPFFSWFKLNALHTPPPAYFDSGIGKIYVFFVREGAELYIDRMEASRCAQSIYRRYGRGGLGEVHTVFVRAKDQLRSSLDTISTQPLEQFVSGDLLKLFQRLSDLYSDMLAASAWLDAFDYGVRNEIVQQIQNAHALSMSDVSVLLASGETTSSVTRRLTLLQLVKEFIRQYPNDHAIDKIELFIGNAKDAQHYMGRYPYFLKEIVIASLAAYAAAPHILEQEFDTLTHLSQRHAKDVKAVLSAHGLRVNPLSFLSLLSAWRDERDEIDIYVRVTLERILRVVAKKARLTFSFASYLLPQEVEHALNGLVNERTLQHRYEQGLLIALEHGEYKVHEGEFAVSVQDDLASRYLSQLEYADVP
jgi:putative transcriptional regulator